MAPSNSIIRRKLEAPLLMEEEEQQQTHQIVSSCMGRKRRKRKTKTELPEDIIHNEILTRLPANSLVRFQLVCKSWKSLFSAPEFINSHLTRLHSNSYKDEDLFLCTKYSEIFIVSHSNEILVRTVSSICDQLLGSINGLLCMSSANGREFCLWNPAIGKLKEVRLPSPHSENCDRHLLGGFSWDPVRNDYKVVVVCYDFLTKSFRQICIYSCNSASWTELVISDHSVLPDGSGFDPRCVMAPSTIVKGIPYWSCSKKLLLPGLKRRRKFIYVYKFVTEINEFRLLPLLDSAKTRGKVFNLVNIKDCLVGMACDYYKHVVNIFSLNEESHSGVWSKMYTFKPINWPSCLWSSHCFRNDGENFIVGYIGPLSLRDPKIKETTKLAELLLCTHCDFRLCFTYTPSMVCIQ